jgi:hypothetical protein
MTRRPQHTWPACGLADAQDQHGLGSSNLAVVLRVLGRRHTLRQRDHWTPSSCKLTKHARCGSCASTPTPIHRSTDGFMPAAPTAPSRSCRC